MLVRYERSLNLTDRLREFQMKYKNLNIFTWVAHLSVILSTFMLSVGLAIAQPTRPNAPGENPTSTLSAPERQELERLREDQWIQKRVQAEVSRTTTLFNLMLVTLALLLVGAIIALFLLRRAVIREVAALVREHLGGRGGGGGGGGRAERGGRDGRQD